ncbi:GNAT family N-acetyltransferase, partial [Williamsia sp.]|uniref:GNAT family N-acetyltransferase n=1 Tax=Williamsia sp. TaxID=1872085 RepID=UPI001A36279B
MNALIRPAVLADAPRLAAVHVAAWFETYSDLLAADVLDTFDVGERTVTWERVLGPQGDPGTTVAVAEIDRSIVGFALSGPPRHHRPARGWELASLYTLSSVHGRGVGAALLEAAVGTRPAEVWLAADNARAAAFYRKHGFVEDGTTNWFERWR